MELNSKKIKKFLKGLNEVDFIYMRYIMNIIENLSNLIKTYSLTKEQFCELMDITIDKYDDFICGNYEYTLKDMANINVAYIKLETKAIENKVPFKTSK